MTLDEVVAEYGDAGPPTEIVVGRIAEEGGDYISIEAPPQGLRFLAAVLTAIADEAEDCDWSIHPQGAGTLLVRRPLATGHLVPSSALC